MCKDVDQFIINMGKLSIKELPASLETNSTATVLNLTENNLQQLPFCPLSLKVIILDWNFFESVSESVFLLKHLKKLICNRNILVTLSPYISALTTLRVLSLNYNKLTELPTLPDSLITLTATNNRLEDLDSVCKANCRLKRIDLSHNLIHTVGDAISLLADLKSLKLSNNSISTVSKSIFVIKRLREVDLSYNKIGCLPAADNEIINTGLVHLNLSHNKISEIPEYFDRLVGLESLQLQSNNTLVFHSTLEKMQRLRVIDLSQNMCVSPIFPSVLCLPSLKILKASFAKLEKFPELTEDSSLEILILAGNEIDKIPESIRHLKKLRILNLSHSDGSCTKYQMKYHPKANKITKLPTSITDLECLEILNLSKTGITELPENIGKLSRLRKLNIGYRGCFKLPDSIGDLHSLEVLTCLECVSMGNLDAVVSACQNITDLMNFVQQISSLRYFHEARLPPIAKSVIIVPSTIQKLRKLRVLKLGELSVGSKDLFSNWSSLRVLSVSKLAFPNDKINFASFLSLHVLDIKESVVNSLVACKADHQNQTITNTIQNLRVLRINGKTFKVLLDQVKGLKSLHTVILDGIDLREADVESLKNLNLKKLELNNFEVINGGIGELKSLEFLNIDSPSLIQFPKEISKLINLRRLRFNCLDIKKMLSVADVVELEKISNNSSVEIDKVPILIDLAINDSDVLKFPNEMEKISTLASFSLNGYKIHEFPQWICNFSNLTSLDISNTHITVLPPSIGDLVNMKIFTARNTGIQVLPKEFGRLCNLEELYIAGIAFKCLPSNLKNLTKLIVLEITFTSLTNLHGTAAISMPVAGPTCISELSYLKILDLRNNKLERLPEDIGSLWMLSELNASSNYLVEFPDGIKNLKLLRKIDVSNNQISLLPEWIGNMKYLCTLNIRKNPIKTIPRCISKLQYLTCLNRDI